jgi:hypothetical protein
MVITPVAFLLKPPLWMEVGWAWGKTSESAYLERFESLKNGGAWAISICVSCKAPFFKFAFHFQILFAGVGESFHVDDANSGAHPKSVLADAGPSPTSFFLDALSSPDQTAICSLNL